MASSFDVIYRDLVHNILDNGIDQLKSEVRTHYADGTPAITRAVEGVSFAITSSMGVPRLRSKFVGAKWACTEMEWIYQAMSNNVQWLHEHGGVTIWDEWQTPSNYYLEGRPVVILDKKDRNHDFSKEYKGDQPKLFRKLIHPTPENCKLQKHWQTMIRRVYGEDERKQRFYLGRGVEVHPDWWDVNTFVKDAKELMNYSYKTNNWDDFVLDKDYYGAKLYSKDTCVWLPQEENMLYTDVVYPINVTDRNGYTRQFLGIKAVAFEYDIPKSTVHRFVEKGTKLTGLKRENKKFNGYVFSKIVLPPSKIARLEPIEGTIGKAYGYQVKNQLIPVNMPNGSVSMMNQMEYALHELRNNPSSRRIMVDLWNQRDTPQMALTPCVWTHHWSVLGDKLNLHVKQRSCDVALGLPYNVVQYYVLKELVADCLGIEAGTLYWTIDNAHIYDRHLETIQKQVDTPMSNEVLQSECKVILPELNTDKLTNEEFFHRPMSETKFEGYKHMGRYEYEVAI